MTCANFVDFFVPDLHNSKILCNFAPQNCSATKQYAIMKNKLYILIILSLFLSSCIRVHEFETPYYAVCTGRMWYVANPFEPETDTILCLRNVQEIVVETPDAEYYSYLKQLFSRHTHEGRLYGSSFFQPDSGVYVFPTQYGKFISIIDSQTGKILDSLVYETKLGSEPVSITIHTELRAKNGYDTYDTTNVYINDLVSFGGNIHMNPPFVTDTITPDGARILCIDSNEGPFLSISDFLDQ